MHTVLPFLYFTCTLLLLLGALQLQSQRLDTPPQPPQQPQGLSSHAGSCPQAPQRREAGLHRWVALPVSQLAPAWHGIRPPHCQAPAPNHPCSVTIHAHTHADARAHAGACMQQCTACWWPPPLLANWPPKPPRRQRLASCGAAPAPHTGRLQASNAVCPLAPLCCACRQPACLQAHLVAGEPLPL